MKYIPVCQMSIGYLLKILTEHCKNAQMMILTTFAQNFAFNTDFWNNFILDENTQIFVSNSTGFCPFLIHYFRMLTKILLKFCIFRGSTDVRSCTVHCNTTEVNNTYLFQDTINLCSRLGCSMPFYNHPCHSTNKDAYWYSLQSDRLEPEETTHQTPVKY